MKNKDKSFARICKSVLNRFSLSHIERLLSVHWFNPIASVYLNIRSFPFKQAIKLPIIVYGRPRFYSLRGKMLIKGRVSTGMIKFNKTVPGAPSYMGCNSEILNDGMIIFGGQGFVGCGTKISVNSSASLKIGANFKITDFVNIGCMRRIDIGNLVRITHRCQIFDSNYHYVANLVSHKVPDYIKPISIGNGCWICNSSVITKGAIIPDFTILGSNSLVNKDLSDIPSNSMIAGVPAKLVFTGLRRVENKKMVEELDDHYSNSSVSPYHFNPGTTIEEISQI